MGIIDEWSRDDTRPVGRRPEAEVHRVGHRGPSQGAVRSTQSIADELGVSRQAIECCLKRGITKARRLYARHGFDEEHLSHLYHPVEHTLVVGEDML